jgi:hypothetical protein
MSVTLRYKVTHDTGFAPNPFHGVLTLATSKRKIRACRKAGDWVAGFASRALVTSAARRGVTDLSIHCGRTARKLGFAGAGDIYATVGGFYGILKTQSI